MSEEEVSAEEAAQQEEEIDVDIHKIIKEVIKKSLFTDGLSRGLHETAKVLDSGQGQICFLAEDCNEATYTKLVKALCSEHDVALLMVPTRVDLGEMVGLCKYDPDGRPRKVSACSCAVIKDFGEETEYLLKLKEHIERIKSEQ